MSRAVRSATGLSGSAKARSESQQPSPAPRARTCVHGYLRTPSGSCPECAPRTTTSVYHPTTDWNWEQDELLMTMYTAGVPLKEISARVGRSVKAVLGRVDRLHLRRDRGA